MEKNKLIKELNITVETTIHDKGKKLNQIKIPKGWRLLTVSELFYLYNNYSEELNLLNTWEFVKYPFKRFKTKYVARFYAGSDRADLVCYGGPRVSIASLGVRFCRDLK